jgi:hypothetical protein
MNAMADDDRLRLEYDRAVAIFRDLTDIRFKLLALVPTLAGAAVGLLKGDQAAVTLLAVGVLGLSATLGILVYELRNSEVRRGAAKRAAELERELLGARLVTSRAKGSPRLFGLLPLEHSLGLALVYGAALAGWSYLVAWGVLDAVNASNAREIGVAIGAVAGLLVLFEVLRIDGRD